MKNAFNHRLRLVTSARTHGRKAAARAFPTTVSAVRKGRRRQAADPTPSKALALLKMLHSVDIILPTTDGREIRLRRVTEPTGEQKKLLAQLALTVPERFTRDRKWSVDSAVA
jgi:hypothetical protein